MSTPSCNDVACQAWFSEQLPDDWFEGPVVVRSDKDEILVVGTLAAPEVPSGADPTAIAMDAVNEFREHTRQMRMNVAAHAQATWRRRVSWGAQCGEIEVRFTSQSVPVMTRLRIDERIILDTLIDAGVARSRSEAMAWCVAQVGQHQGEWLGRLRTAVSEVERIRAEGPDAGM